MGKVVLKNRQISFRKFADDAASHLVSNMKIFRCFGHDRRLSKVVPKLSQKGHKSPEKPFSWTNEKNSSEIVSKQVKAFTVP